MISTGRGWVNNKIKIKTQIKLGGGLSLFSAPRFRGIVAMFSCATFFLYMEDCAGVLRHVLPVCRHVFGSTVAMFSTCFPRQIDAMFFCDTFSGSAQTTPRFSTPHFSKAQKFSPDNYNKPQKRLQHDPKNETLSSPVVDSVGLF